MLRFAVIVLAWLPALAYAQGPVAAPTAVLTAVSMDTYVRGFRTEGSKYESFDWAIDPVEAGPFLWKAEVGGKPTAICFYRKDYTIVFAALSNNQVAVAIKHIEVEAPQPPPEPPNPKPPPDPPGPSPGPQGDWAKWTRQSVEQHIPASGRREAALKLAVALEGVIAKASTYESTRLYREATKRATHNALGPDSQTDKRWTKWSDEQLEPKLARLYLDGKLSTIEQYAAIQADIAKGLRAVTAPKSEYQRAHDASRKDKGPLVCIITSPDCVPCDRLKAEFLPWAKRNKLWGNSHLVMLDRKADEPVVKKVATIGMKGRIVVPQIYVQRYLQNRWWQFHYVGYVNVATTDLWLRGVFRWKPKE
ncbi:MAG: hypothetical protein ACYS30_25535 [Planctomycetota bacterium]|jgi:hypothetical protein